jgi:hypothetical protein
MYYIKIAPKMLPLPKIFENLHSPLPTTLSRRVQPSLGFQLLEEQISIFQPETSVGGLSCLDLLFHPVSEHLEASNSKAELLSSYNNPGGRS